MYDVVILGAGLAGAAMANLLCQEGCKVVILDKGDSPGFNLPETALLGPSDLFTKLGLSAHDLKIVFNPEMVACFKSPDGNQELSLVHRFKDSFADQSGATLCRVDRSRLDYLILQKAIQFGAIYKPGSDVQFVNLDSANNPSVVYKELGECKTLTASYIIDASGKSALLANQLKLKDAIHHLDARHLLFSHFENNEFRKSLTNNAVYLTEINQGYIFVIPLRGDRFSVGTVLVPTVSINKKHLDQAFHAAILGASWIDKAVSASTRKLPYLMATQESFISKTFCTENYLLIGEATGFRDPFYCNGIAITLAMIPKALLTVTKLLSSQKSSAITETYNSDIRQLITNRQYDVSHWVNDNSLKVNASRLCDPHLPYGIANFLSHLSCSTGKSNPAATMKLLREKFAEA